MRRNNLKSNRNTIEFNEIFEFFMNSWKKGFQLLENILNNSSNEFNERNIFIPRNSNQLEFLLQKNEKQVRQYLVSSLSEFNVNLNSGIGYEIFKNWIEKGHDLEIVYVNKRLRVAVSLLCLNDIVLVM